MKLNKFTNLEYIYNGKLSVINAIYSHDILDGVPLYYSGNVFEANIIKINDGDIIALVNKSYADKVGKDLLKMIFWRLRIKSLYHNLSDEALDLICVKSIGIDNTIKIITLSDKNVMDRISNIKSNIDNINKLNLINDKTFLLCGE